MAQFSIRQAVKFAFTAYVKHWMVLLSASVLLGLSGYLLQVGPRMAAEKMGVYQSVEIDLQVNAGQPVVQRVNMITEKIAAHLESSPKHYLLLLLLLLLACYFLHVFFMCALARVSLRLKDKDAAVVSVIFEDKTVALKVLGIMLVIMLYAVCMLVGIAVLSIPTVLLIKSVLGAGMLRMMMGMTSFFVILFAFVFWFVGYMFPVFCMIDKPKTTIQAALSMGKAMVSGLRLKLMGSLFIVGLIVIPLSLLVKNVAMMAGIHAMPLQQAVMVAFVSPVMYLYLSFIYRSLSSK